MRGMAGNVTAVVPASALIAAQSTGNGEISSRITDALGGVLPGVTVTDGSERRTTYTDSDGEFRIGTLKPGSYKVSAELQSFVSVSGVVTLTSDVRLNTVLSWARQSPLAKR